MRLYMVEDSENANYGVFFYWAKDEGDAISQHEAQMPTPEVEWAASPVWASNEDARYRGFVVEDSQGIKIKYIKRGDK